jgi:hypothetical protein
VQSSGTAAQNRHRDRDHYRPLAERSDFDFDSDFDTAFGGHDAPV